MSVDYESKYEIRYYINATSNGTKTEHTNSWLEFMWLRLINSGNVIYHTVYHDVCPKCGRRKDI